MNRRTQNKSPVPSFSEFGRALAQARLAAGIDSQSELAARLNCAQQSVSRWESGVARPKVAQIAALAAVVGLEPSHLLELAGYAPPMVAAHSAQLFPVDRLEAEIFERFVEYLLILLYPEPDAKVQRAGASGHKQDGLDITVTWGTKRYSYQCKRVERFGPAEVLRAVEAHTATADKKHLVLSRIASPQAVEALRLFPDWELWDKEKLTSLIRLQLSPDDQDRLVDIFFRGQRLGLLGRAEAGPWMTAEEFFAPWQRRDAIFSHEWSLRGRQKEIIALVEALRRANAPVILVTGPGGIGKSRIIKEAMADNAFPGSFVRFLSSSAEVTRAGLEALRMGPKILVVDDAHDRDGHGALFEYAADSRHQTKLLMATRPYAETRIKGDAANYGIGDVPSVSIERLTEDQTTDLVREVLMAFNGDQRWARNIVSAAGDCPLIAVMAARIIARDVVPSELAKNDGSLRDLVMRKFMRVIAGELGSSTDQEFVRGTLEVLALVQPFHVEDPQLVELLGKVKGMDATDISRVLRLLLDGGIIYRRGHQYRLMPDLLGDYIIESCCIGPNDRLSPFAERVFGAAAGSQLTNVLVNLGRLDWRKAGGDPSESPLLDNIWRKLDDVEDEQDPRFEAVRSVAIFQPKQALDFIQNQFDKGRVPRGTASIVRNIAYNFRYVDDACELLWALGCDDNRDLGRHPDHAIRVLTELCGFEEQKPLSFTERVFNFGMSLVDRPGAWSHKHSPLDVLKAVLSGEGVTTTSEGRQLRMSPFFVSLDVVAPLRRRLIDKVLTLLTHHEARIAGLAADFLAQALRAPIGLMGAVVEMDVHDQYQIEFRGTLSKLYQIIASGNLHPGVLIAIGRSVSWHAEFGPKTTAGAAKRVLKALPTTLTFRTRLALADGFGRIFDRAGSAGDWHSRQKARTAAITVELRARFLDREMLRKHIEAALVDLGAVRDSENSTFVLIGSLLHDDLELSVALVQDSVLRPASLTRRFVGAALHEILCLSPTEGRTTAQKFLMSNDLELVCAAASAMGGMRRPVQAEDITLLRLALSSTDERVKNRAIGTLWTWRDVDDRARIELAKLVEIETSAQIADDLCMMFAGDEKLLSALNKSDVEHFLRCLLNVPHLDGHWLEQLLVHISFRYPHELADFFFKRVETAANARTFGEFRPANHGPYANTQLKISDSSEAAEVLRKTWAWLRANERRDVYFQLAAADVFSAMFMSVDDAMVDLFETKLESASKAELGLMTRLLGNARPNFIFAHRPFVVRFLERCRDAGDDLLRDAHSGLFGSAISGIRGGPVGEPAEGDVKMVADAKESLKQISRLSSAYRLYDSVKKWGEQSIERTVLDGQALDEQ